MMVLGGGGVRKRKLSEAGSPGTYLLHATLTVLRVGLETLLHAMHDLFCGIMPPFVRRGVREQARVDGE